MHREKTPLNFDNPEDLLKKYWWLLFLLFFSFPLGLVLIVPLVIFLFLKSAGRQGLKKPTVRKTMTTPIIRVRSGGMPEPIRFSVGAGKMPSKSKAGACPSCGSTKTYIVNGKLRCGSCKYHES